MAVNISTVPLNAGQKWLMRVILVLRLVVVDGWQVSVRLRLVALFLGLSLLDLAKDIAQLLELFADSSRFLVPCEFDFSTLTVGLLICIGGLLLLLGNQKQLLARGTFQLISAKEQISEGLVVTHL
jgi:hypothetical protein